MKRRCSILVAIVMVLALLLSCGPAAPEPTPTAAPTRSPEPAPSKVLLTPNPVETSMPIYGGIIEGGFDLPRSFDAHQKVAYGPTVTLPVFNQLVMFDLGFKETGPETIIGDLAESWEWSEDGRAITFKLRQGVKWHDGEPFTADDVTYSLDKMTDPKRSAISDWFPAYAGLTEKIDEYTVKVHLKYPSAGFMLALAQGESQIQARHLAGTNDRSADFVVGTGPFILEEFKRRAHLKYKRNPDYWKKDEYGNQLPYLDGIIFYKMSEDAANNALLTAQLDFTSPRGGTSMANFYRLMRSEAPGLLWQKREGNNGVVLFLNTSHPPLDDIRVRRALGLVLEQEDLIIAYGSDPAWYQPGSGLLHSSYGLPREEVTKLMGWRDQTYQERVAEAKKLLALAGYSGGFKLKMLTSPGTKGITQYSSGDAGITRLIANILRRHLKIEVEMSTVFSTVEMWKRIDEDKYDTFTHALMVGRDPIQLTGYFGTDGDANYSKYSNPELDKMLAELDRILEPKKRREVIWAIERILLIDKPALPTGVFPRNFMPYYPHVKNLRFTNMVYSNINRLEDVWNDESLRVK